MDRPENNQQRIESTTWHDSTARLDYPDQRGMVSKVDSGVLNHHWGPRQESNFDLHFEAHGKASLKDLGETSFHSFPTASADLIKVRQHLLDLAHDEIADKLEGDKFIADMIRLETRAQVNGVSEQQVKETYRAAGQLLNAKAGKLDHADRVHIAEQILSNAASPQSIDQGVYPTCVLAATETLSYTKFPGAAARLVSELALTGKSYTAELDRVSLDNCSLQPADDQARRAVPEDGQRSLASQIFQLAAANIHYAKSPLVWADSNGKMRVAEPGDIKVEQRPSSDNDSGMRLIDYNADKAQVLDEAHKPVDYPMITGPQALAVFHAITGGEAVCLVNKTSLPAEADNATIFSSEQDLQSTLAALKAGNKLPVMVRVDSFHPPFYQEDGSWHIVTITNFDKTNSVVSIDNQWGGQFDLKTVSLHDLFRATRYALDAQTLSEDEKEVHWLRQQGRPSRQKEADLLRLRKYTEK